MSTDPGRPVQVPPTRGTQVAPGDVIGKYRIVRHVGIGGMAQVFLAHRQGPEGFSKPYVIKRILPQYSQDEQFARMFVVEATVAALLDHPNIVHVFDFEIEDGNYYLVMEYVAGASLAQLLRANRRRGTPLGAHIAVEIGAAIAHALAYAHEVAFPDGRSMELVHRDISPGNVLLSRDGAVKLADFGVVKTSQTATHIGVVNGKWAYMAPEQIAGQAIDRRADLFSLGIVLYEIITGVRLFRGENAAATASRVMNADIRRPIMLVPELDPRLDRIVMTMVERDLGARYQSAAALASDLEAMRALPQFAAGRIRLSTLVRTLLPDEGNVPALSVSLLDPARPSPVTTQGVVPPGVGPSREVPDDEIVSGAALGGPVSHKLIVAIVAASLLGTLLFWLAVS